MAFPRETTSNVGAILVTNIPAVFAGDVTLSSRLFELSRNTQPAGIHLPVVREDRFFTKPARFLSVESSSKLRTSLRVYDPRVQVGKTARVEFFASDGRPLGETNLTFTYGGASFEPGVAAVHDLTAAFPQLQSVDRYDIRVTADGAEYWALVSVTDNETQQVMLITAD